MHLDREALLRFSDDRLGPVEGGMAEAHLSVCADCRERLDDVRLFRLLDVLDDPPPAVTADQVIARAGRTNAAPVGRWAAALVLTLGAAGAVYAAPGSPLPAWVASLSSGPVETPVSPPRPRPDPGGASGVVVPVGVSLIIEIGPQSSGSIEVRLVDDASVTVEAVNGRATFDSRVDRVVVTSAATPDYHVSVPREAPSVDVLVGDRPVFRLIAGRVLIPVDVNVSGLYTIAFADVR